MQHFGEHLMIDGYGGVQEKLDSEELVFRCLNELPEELGMTKLTRPIVFRAPGNSGKDPGGWSGFVVIAESHLSVHTFPARGFVSIDVYTCKNGLDTRYTEKYFRDLFGLQELEVNFVERGTRYPTANLPS
jgi:S-adenosylmethionine decarboxylase